MTSCCDNFQYLACEMFWVYSYHMLASALSVGCTSGNEDKFFLWLIAKGDPFLSVPEVSFTRCR